MGVCKCSVGLKNTGFACTSIMGVAIGGFMFNRFKENGELNQIDFAAEMVNGVLPFQAILDRINDVNPADRWYPIGLYENVEDTRAEILSQTFNSGNSAKIKDGIRSFLGLLIKKAPAYVDVLESFACNDVAGMYYDDNGNLLGESIDGNNLRGISIDQNTISAVFGKTTDSEVSAIAHSYNFSQTVNDSNLSMIGSDEIGGDIKAVKGLLDSTILSNGGATATGTPVKVVVNYGMNLADKTPLKSLALGDFVINNVTQSTVVTIDSLDTSLASEGIYVLAYSSGVVSTDVIRISATKTGYEIAPLTETVA